MNQKEPLYNKVEEYILGVCFAAMVLIAGVNAFSRYFFDYTFSWAEQACRLCFIWIATIGASYTTLKLSHLKVTAIHSFIPQRGRLILRIVSNIIVVIFGVVCTIYLYKIFYNTIIHKETFSSMPWLPAWVKYLPGLLGFAGMCVRTIQVELIPACKELFNKGGDNKC